MLSTTAAVYQSPMAKYVTPQYLAPRIASAVFLHETGNATIPYMPRLVSIIYDMKEIRYKRWNIGSVLSRSNERGFHSMSRV